MGYPGRMSAAAWGCAALAVLCGVDVGATTVVPPTFEQLVDGAARVVVTEVVSVEPRVTVLGGARAIVSAVTFRTLRRVKGETTPTTFTVEFLGGTVGEETLEIVGAPRWVAGDRDVLFFGASPSRLSPLVRLMHGRVRVTVDAAGVETVAFYSGAPIAGPQSFGPGRDGGRESGRPMTLRTFLAAVEQRVATAASR